MALHTCKECNYEVSTSAKACPKCGADAPTHTFNRPFIWIVIIGAFLIWLAAATGVLGPDFMALVE